MATVQELKEKGNDAFKRGDHAQALELYSQAITLAGSQPADSPDQQQLHLIYSNRAATLLTLEKFEDALADCERVLQMDPKFLKGYLRKAMALRALGRKREALEVAKMGLQANKDPKTVGVPELTKLAHAIQGDLKPKMTKRTQQETEELVKDYNEVVAEVEQLNYELETRDRTLRSMRLTLDYVNQVESQSQQAPNTYLPVGRMFVKKPVGDLTKELQENIQKTSNEFDALREKMKANETKLKSLSSELEEIMRNSQ